VGPECGASIAGLSTEFGDVYFIISFMHNVALGLMKKIQKSLASPRFRVLDACTRVRGLSR
jgi:hypothetical protein